MHVQLKLPSCLFPVNATPLVELSQLPFSTYFVRSVPSSGARQERPDVEGMKKLADSVDEFTSTLIDSLKSDKQSREAFGDSLDSVIDKAIKYKQKLTNEGKSM